MKRFLFVVATLVALRAEAGPRIELVAPRANAVLEGGREATIAWSASSLPERVEEWEAFLSVDGGAYFSVRITPHLDAGIRSFRWRVPNVRAAAARILIRVGDEREEQAIAFPQTFTIVPGVDADSLNVNTSDAQGERALPDAPPVVQWVSGDRSGANLATHRQREPEAIDSEHVLQDDAIVAAQLADSVLPRPRRANVFTIPVARAVAFPTIPHPDRPLLLQTMRLNI